ncbi:MAG: DUF4359 domain-containing protein [Bacteroidaceae bacterium]|nr:DUF4359 domain-containing protein [Bacteroidaceae bacterium]
MHVNETDTNDSPSYVIVNSNQGSSILKRFSWIIALAIILGIMAVTTPNKDSHIRAIRSSLLESIDTSDSTATDKEAAMLLGAGLIDKVLDSKLHVDNYIIFSTGKIDTGKEDKTVSFGILTHVFVGEIDDKKLKDSMK